MKKFKYIFILIPIFLIFISFSSSHYVIETNVADIGINIDKVTVTYKDCWADSSNNCATELGSITQQKLKGTQVRGKDLGSNSNLGEYYSGYKYKSDTSTIANDNVTVYRYFYKYTNVSSMLNGVEKGKDAGTFSISYNNGGTWYNDSYNETDASYIPYGAIIKIKNIKPADSHYELKEVMMWNNIININNGEYSIIANENSLMSKGIQVRFIYKTYNIIYDKNYFENNILDTLYNTNTFSQCCTNGSISSKSITADKYGRMYSVTGTNGWYFPSLHEESPLETGVYTFTYEVKGNTNFTMGASGSERGTRWTGPITTEWTRVAHTTTLTKSNSYRAFVFYDWNNANTSRSIQVRNIQMSKGGLNTETKQFTYNNVITLPNLTREGYEFKGWFTDPISGTKLTGTEKITENKTIYAHWEGKQYTLTVKRQNSHGSISGESSGAKWVNQLMTVTAAPASGYKFLGWSNGTDIVSTNTSYTFSMPGKNYQLTALFIIDSVNNGEIVPYNEDITYIIIKDTKSWKDAEAYAKTLGGHLAKLDTKEKNDLIASKVSSISDTWFGLTDEGHEGEWRWVYDNSIAGYVSCTGMGSACGTSISKSGWVYDNWNSGEPNNTQHNDGANGEHFGEMRVSGNWNDYPNGVYSLPFIVEIHNNE